MLDKDRVFSHFVTMTGLGEQAAGSFRVLCEAAGRYLAGRLREGALAPENMDRLCLAAGALAYGDWLELGGNLAQTQEVRVGEITLREGGARAAPSASKLREHFLAGVADLLAPRFVLGQISQQAGESPRVEL